MLRLLILSFFISNLALAGNGTSGGGGAFVCRDNNGNIQSSYLLDLWEGKQLLNFNIAVSNESVDIQLNRALTKLQKADSLLASKTAELIPALFASARILGDDIALPAPSDADSRYQKKGCPLEGMMFYDGDLDQLQISPSVFDKLATNTDIAASKLHEALYYAIRNHVIINTGLGAPKNSVQTRKLVGCLFSTNNECLFPTLSKNQIIESSEAVYLCENSQLSYYLFKKNPIIESSFPSSGCTGKTNEQWIGLLDRIEDHILNVPTLFVTYKGGFELTETCSSLRSYGFTTSFKVRRNNIDDQVDGHPVLAGFSDENAQTSQNSKYGTPTCKKIK